MEADEVVVFLSREARLLLLLNARPISKFGFLVSVFLFCFYVISNNVEGLAYVMISILFVVGNSDVSGEGFCVVEAVVKEARGLIGGFPAGG